MTSAGRLVMVSGRGLPGRPLFPGRAHITLSVRPALPYVPECTNLLYGMRDMCIRPGIGRAGGIPGG